MPAPWIPPGVTPTPASQAPAANGVASRGAQASRFALEDHAHTALNLGVTLFKKTGLDLNSTSDQALTALFSFTDYLITDVILSNVSTTLAASLATVGLYTGTSGGGTTIVTAGLVQGLTTSSKTLPLTILNGRISGSALNAKLGVAHGVAATCDLHVLGVALA